MKDIDLILDDSEILAIQMFFDNQKQFQAVKKVLLWEIYQNGTLKKGENPNPLRNSFMGVAMTADDPLKIGQRVMAMAEGINFLELGFKQLSKYSKKEEKIGDNANQAR